MFTVLPLLVWEVGAAHASVEALLARVRGAFYVEKAAPPVPA